MQGDSRDVFALRLHSFVQFSGKQHIGKFALEVGGPSLVTLGSVQIFVINLSTVVTHRRDNDNTTPVLVNEIAFEQQIGHQEVSQMIHAELKFESVLGQCVRRDL